MQVGAGQIRRSQFYFAQIRALQIGIAQNGSAEVGALKVGFGKVCASSVGAYAALLALKKKHVGRKDIGQLLAIVFDAFYFFHDPDLS